jgi:hypothetical protein
MFDNNTRMNEALEDAFLILHHDEAQKHIQLHARILPAILVLR